MTIKGKKVSTTKILVTFLFINCTLLEIFTGWMTIWNLILAIVLGRALLIKAKAYFQNHQLK